MIYIRKKILYIKNFSKKKIFGGKILLKNKKKLG
jgi:hypothetical protein